MRAREAQLEAAEGARREAASALFNNPWLSAEGIRAHAEQPQGSWNEWSVGIAQPFETGGQQARRREAAASALDALRAEIEDMRRQARADAALRFNEVLAAQRRRAARATLGRTVQRHRAGRGPSAAPPARTRAWMPDVALIEAERSRDALALAGEKLSDARSALATAVQLPPSALPEVADEATADVAAPSSYTLEQLLAAMQAMPRNRALASREDAARARLELSRQSQPGCHARAERRPRGPRRCAQQPRHVVDLAAAAAVQPQRSGHRPGADRSAQSQIERTSVLRDAEARVRQLWSRLNSQRQRLQRLQRVLTQAAADNQQLSARSRQAGQIGLLEQLLVNHQALDAERELNELRAEQRATRIEIEYAAGWPQEGTAR